MKISNNILIFSRSLIDSGMANVNQTLHMAQALGQQTNVYVFMRVRNIASSQKTIEKIIGQKPSFNFTGKDLPSLIFLVFFLAALFFKERGKNVIYTRSIMVGLLGRLLGFRSCVELHQDKLVNLPLLDSVLISILKLKFFTNYLEIIVISNALKKIIETKYGILGGIKVLHDAAVPPNAEYLRLLKRERSLVVYTGKLENERSIDKLVQIAACFPQCDFRLIGGTRIQVAYYRAMAQQMGLKNIKVFLRQGYNRVRYFQCKADILVAFWSLEVPTMDYCSPLKLFEYMQTGNQILVHDFPVLREVVPSSPMIEFADPRSVSSATLALASLLDNKLSKTMQNRIIEHGKSFSYEARALSLIASFEQR